jgi:hypothetical protein
MIDFFTRSGFTPNFYSKACESPMPPSLFRYKSKTKKKKGKMARETSP